MFTLTPFNTKGYDIFDAFDEFDKNFFGREFPTMNCRTDIRDEGEKYVLEAEMPGFEKEDIKLDINGDYLTLTAEHKTESGDKDKNGKYIRRERVYGSYKRSFDVSNIKQDEIDASYKNGILTLNMPKKAPEAPASRRLEIK